MCLFNFDDLLFIYPNYLHRVVQGRIFHVLWEFFFLSVIEIKSLFWY